MKEQYRFGNRSKDELETLHSDWHLVLNKALSLSLIDFSITEGHRSTLRQQELYAIGRSVMTHKSPITNIDGVTKKSKHNYLPSLAVDIAIYHPNKSYRKILAYDVIHLAYVVGVIQSTAKELFRLGKITHLVRSGGNWDNDGVMKLDQSFFDLPHLELYRP